MPTQFRPYPYLLLATNSKVDQRKFEKSHVLIIGDQTADRLINYLLPVKSQMNSSFSGEFNISRLPGKNMGLHRVIHHLKGLNKIPPFIIYLGGNHELFEKKFHVKYQPTILRNIKFFQNRSISTLIYSFPWASKLIYSKVPLVHLDQNIKTDRQDYTSEERIKQFELSYKVFGLEVQELIDVVQRSRSTLVVIGTPINLDFLPERVCAITAGRKVELLQNDIKKMINNNELDAAYKNLKQLELSVPGNARTYFLLGKTAKKMKRFFTAIEYFKMANILDCGQSPKGNFVYNSILTYLAQKNGIPYIDFNRFLYKSGGTFPPFSDEGIYPNDIYYSKIGAILIKHITKKFQL